MKTNKKSFTKGKNTKGKITKGKNTKGKNIKGKITKGKIKKVFNNYEIKKILNKRLEKDFSAWKNIDKSNYQEIIEKFYIENRNRHKILKIEIKNNKVTADMEYLKKYKLFLLRGKIIYDMFKFILSKINIKIPYLVLYVSLGDEIVSQELPILGFAKSYKSNGILIPDWTFHNPYKSKIKSTWVKQMKQISKICNKINTKKNIIFFQGSDTSYTDNPMRIKEKTFIRRNLKNVSLKDTLEDKIPTDILIDNEPKSSITDWCKYKYLLDLPGAHPWSVRLKELLLTKSLIIKIDVKDYWINFYSDIFKPNKDYIQIKFDNSPSISDKVKNTEKCYKEIQNSVKKIKPETYKRITNSAYNKIIMLNNPILIFYFENLIKKYLKIFT